MEVVRESMTIPLTSVIIDQFTRSNVLCTTSNMVKKGGAVGQQQFVQEGTMYCKSTRANGHLVNGASLMDFAMEVLTF